MAVDLDLIYLQLSGCSEVEIKTCGDTQLNYLNQIRIERQMRSMDEFA